MRKERRHKRIAILGGAILVFLVTSCTNEDFWGIEKETSGLDYRTLKKISQSEEFIEFQKQSLISMEVPMLNDTCDMEMIDSINEQHFLVSKTKYSIRPVLDARQKLVEIYPEYEIATNEERNQILNLALIDNMVLRKMVEKYIPNVLNKTKSVNEESDAVRWIRKKNQNELLSDSNDWSELITGANSEWSVGSCIWYAYNNYYNTIYDALVNSEGLAKEVGGYCWESDGSGILIDDPSATLYYMTFGHWDDAPIPSFDFHVHPNGVLYPSEADATTWKKLPTVFHRIYDCAGYYRIFKNKTE